MISTLAVSNTANRQNIKLQTFYAFLGSPSSVRVKDLPTNIGTWDIDKVYVKVNYPDNNTYTVECTKVDDTWVGTVPASTACGISQNGYQIVADGTDEKGNERTGYVLGAGDLEIIDNISSAEPIEHQIMLSLKSELPENPSTGDICKDPEDGLYKIYQFGQWNALGQSASTITWGNIAGNMSAQTDLNDALGSKRDYKDLGYKTEIVYDDWTPSHTPIPENPQEGDVYYGHVYHVGGMGEWGAFIYEYNGSDWIHIDEIFMSGDYTNPNAKELTFPDGTITYKQKTVEDKIVLSSEIPTVNDSTITIKQGDEVKGTFTLNQNSNKTIEIDAGGGGTVGHTVTIKCDGGSNDYYLILTAYFADGTNQPMTIYGGDQPTSLSNVIGFSWLENHYNKFAGMSVDEKYMDNTYVPIVSDGQTYTLLTNHPCILKGTMITLSDFSKKPIEEITYEDELLTWDFDNGKFSHQKPSWIKIAQTTDYHWMSKFESGRELRTCGKFGHRIFDLDKNKFLYVTDAVGDRVIDENGNIDRLIYTKRIETESVFYNLNTKHDINCYANGILTSCRLNNIYPISDMKFVKDERVKRQLSDYVDVPEDWYIDNRYDEQTLPIEELRKYYHERKNIKL